MPIWQRLGIVLVVVVVGSFIAGLLWQWIFNAGIPAYLSGVVGGLAALPAWEFLKRVGPKPSI